MLDVGGCVHGHRSIGGQGGRVSPKLFKYFGGQGYQCPPINEVLLSSSINPAWVPHSVYATGCVADIVFLKAWSAVKVDEVYSVQAEHMLPPGDKDKWPQMKTVGQLRRERQLHRTVNPDHLYKVSPTSSFVFCSNLLSGWRLMRFKAIAEGLLWWMNRILWDKNLDLPWRRVIRASYVDKELWGPNPNLSHVRLPNENDIRARTCYTGTKKLYGVTIIAYFWWYSNIMITIQWYTSIDYNDHCSITRSINIYALVIFTALK